MDIGNDDGRDAEKKLFFLWRKKEIFQIFANQLMIQINKIKKNHNFVQYNILVLFFLEKRKKQFNPKEKELTQ